MRAWAAGGSESIGSLNGNSPDNLSLKCKRISMRQLYLAVLLLSIHPVLAQPQLTAKLDSLFRRQPGDQPGLALSIEKNGRVIYRNETGVADKNTGTMLDSLSNFRMASLTKQFTAMGILLLEKDHRLSFDESIRDWLPELPAGIGNQILIRHLLTHSSGLLDYESLIPPSRMRQVLDIDVLHLLQSQDTTYFTPGTRFRYSNSGFCLLALIIERASHQSYATFIKERIFEPLQMDNSVVYEKDRPIPNRALGYAKNAIGRIVPSDQSITSATKGDGGVYTSLADYSKWIRAVQENTLLRLAPTLQRLRFPLNGSRPQFSSAPANSYYAAGWFLTGDSPLILFHPGGTSGFSSFVIQVPGDEWSIVYFSNLADNIAPFKDIISILKETRMGNFSQVLALYELTASPER
jgi:CubicO group peptidase (beta-lactamase class C family)